VYFLEDGTTEDDRWATADLNYGGQSIRSKLKN